MQPQSNNTQAVSTKKQLGDIKLYATVRPTYGYIDENNETFWDVQDALSHAGFKSQYHFKAVWSATAHSEWSIDLGNNGDFGKARQIYVALDSPIGKFELGKQRPVQYTLIAEHVDIFNHRNSPFACDVYRPFFVDDMATYQKSFDRFKFMLAGQFDGDNDINSADFVNTGLGDSYQGFHMAATYSTRDNFDENNT